jgi:hypothetical protein
LITKFANGNFRHSDEFGVSNRFSGTALLTMLWYNVHPDNAFAGGEFSLLKSPFSEKPGELVELKT